MNSLKAGVICVRRGNLDICFALSGEYHEQRVIDKAMMNNDELLEQMHRSKIEMVDVDKLLPYARNARTHSDLQVEQIIASLKEFGYTNPILLDGGTEIIAGHGRLMALGKMGVKKAPCIRLPHLTEGQKKAYRLADNQLALNSGWDMDLLKIELQDLDSCLKFDIDLIGFKSDTLQDLGLIDPEPSPPERKAKPKPVKCPDCGHEFYRKGNS